MTALKRVAKNTIEKRLLNAKGQPNFGLSFYVPEREGRVRRRLDVRVELRGMHGEWAADAQDRRAVPGPGDGLDRRDPVTNDERMGAGADSSARRLERPVPFPVVQIPSAPPTPCRFPKLVSQGHIGIL